MSVALKWIEPEELGAYLKKGWTEVELRFEASGKYLIASPEEPASEKPFTRCPNCKAIILHIGTQEPASEGAKCPNCGEPVEELDDHEWAFERASSKYTCEPCKPAQPEPAAGWRDGSDESVAFDLLTQPQPAKVRMTEELERMVYFFENMGSESAKKDAAAVRAQAAEAGKVTLPKEGR